MRLLRDVLPAGAIALAAGLAFAAPPLGPWLGGLSVDLLFWLRHQAAGPRTTAAESPTAVIAVDEETYRRPPFAETPKALWTPHLARVIEAVLDAGASVVGQDIVLPTSVERFLPGHDRPYLLALRNGARQGRIVLGKVQHQKLPLAPHPAYSYAVGHGKNVRLVNLTADPDGVVRRVPLFFRENTAEGEADWRTSMALELAARKLGESAARRPGGGVRLGERSIPTTDDAAMLVNFVGGGAGIPVYSLADLYACLQEGHGGYLRRAFAGRVVVIGAVLDVEDRKTTSMRFVTGPDRRLFAERCALPVMERLYAERAARRSVPAALIHAQAVNDLLSGDVLRAIGDMPRAGLIVGLAILAALGASAWRLPWTIAAVAAGTLGWAGLATWAFMESLQLPLLEAPIAGIAATAGTLGYRFAVTDRDKRRIRQSFSQYVSREVVDELVNSGQVPELGGEIRSVTVWFSDLAGFTEQSEDLPPERLVEALNAYLTEVTEIIVAHRGMIDKYVGDAVVGVFGAPLDDADHARNAVAAALACQERLTAAGDRLSFRPGRPPTTRIGLNTGPALVGNIGSAHRMSYTVMGDTVNLAARLEGANKLYGTRILCSETTAEACGDSLALREIDRVRVLGRTTPVRLFEPLSGPRDPDARADFDAARAALAAGRFREAAERFEALAADDPVAASLARRARLFAENPPPGWDGILDLDRK